MRPYCSLKSLFDMVSKGMRSGLTFSGQAELGMMRPVHPLVLRADDLAGITAIEPVADLEFVFISDISLWFG